MKGNQLLVNLQIMQLLRGDTILNHFELLTSAWWQGLVKHQPCKLAYFKIVPMFILSFQQLSSLAWWHSLWPLSPWLHCSLSWTMSLRSDWTPRSLSQNWEDLLQQGQKILVRLINERQTCVLLYPSSVAYLFHCFKASMVMWWDPG